MRRSIFAAFLALSFVASPVRAQVPAPAAQVQAPAADARQALSTGAQALPEPAAPPRTLRAYWHVFAAFAFAWLVLFGYAISLARRFRRLEEQVDALARP